MFKEFLHLFPVASEYKNYLSGEVLNLSEQIVKDTLATIAVSVSELICFVDEIYTAF